MDLGIKIVLVLSLVRSWGRRRHRRRLKDGRLFSFFNSPCSYIFALPSPLYNFFCTLSLFVDISTSLYLYLYLLCITAGKNQTLFARNSPFSLSLSLFRREDRCLSSCSFDSRLGVRPELIRKIIVVLVADVGRKRAIQEAQFANVESLHSRSPSSTSLVGPASINCDQSKLDAADSSRALRSRALSARSELDASLDESHPGEATNELDRYQYT